MKIVLDTSALLSLAAGNVLGLITENIDCVIPKRVESELSGISKNNNFEGNLAKEIMSFIGKEISALQAYKSSKEGELECAYLANELKDVEFLITDDTMALEKLEKLCEKKVRFSTIIVYALYLKRKITKKQGLDIIERMRVKRNWKDNILFEQAKLLWEELK